ncbi:unnamed protein product [Lactuca saligna]|uniref:RING-type domain-containing protein n=1 Tax=Lactuca saligna TaxID=75948 RepID=A0AA35YPH1_LACSI|nr:unnamed protein product [Lactuca saligna]
MAEEDEVLIEVEAAESVYGDDCVVLAQYPPHLHLLIKPRTADVSSQQLVVQGLMYMFEFLIFSYVMISCQLDDRAGDEQRQKHLITSIHEKACELSSNSMLVALCEEAVEKLTSMNHPDGDCPLCLSPLVVNEEGALDNSLPFMKLMSCFHCFHCECIIRWWNWLQMHQEVDHHANSSTHAHQIKTQPEIKKNMEDRMGICPVCRKVFHAKDIEHVLNLVGTYSQLNLDDTEDTKNDTILNSDSENTKREKFEATMKLQQENNGLIEQKKTEVLMPGMFLPRPTPTTTTTAAAAGEQAVKSETDTGVPVNKPSGSHRRSSGPRSKYRGRNSRTQVNNNRQWVVKDNGNV